MASPSGVALDIEWLRPLLESDWWSWKPAPLLTGCVSLGHSLSGPQCLFLVEVRSKSMTQAWPCSAQTSAQGRYSVAGSCCVSVEAGASGPLGLTCSS